MERRKLTPEQDALEHIVDCRDKPFLEERYINSNKGRGVFTLKAIKRSSFVVEYRGNISPQNGPRPKRKCGDTLNNYLFEFSWKGERWRIDASTEDGTLGRLVNDDHTRPNCEMRKIVCEGTPHLCLFAIEEISPGEEITYNYGNSSYPWRLKFEDSEADMDEQPDTKRHKNGSFTNIKNKTPADSDSSEEMSGTFKPQASCSQQEEKAVSSDELDSDRAFRLQKARPKVKGPSFSRKNYCYVCGAGFIKIARHLLRHADEEPDIAEAFALRKNSKERKKLLEKLRNRGNYKHNQEVLKHNRGELKVKRRPQTMEVSAKEHVHCLYCKGMYQRKEIWRHAARCSSRPTEMSATDVKTGASDEDDPAHSPLPQEIPSGVWNILVTLKNKIASAIQDDFLLMELAQSLFEKHKDNPRKNEHIGQTLKEVGRLLVALKEKFIFSFEDAIKPHNFCKVVEAVKDIAGFDEETQNYKKTSLALKLVRSLKKIATIVLTGFDGNERMMRETNKFLNLCATEWSKLTSQKLIISFSEQKVYNPSTIPFVRDVQVFYKYLETTSASAIESLKMHESSQAYSALCRVILTQASVLNKCAPEVSNMTLKAFQERDDTTQVLSKHFVRINIQSRTGQNVAVLLTSELVSAMTLLLSKREACGVHQDNPYLFAKPNSSSISIYHGGNCIRHLSNLCCAKKPEHLRWVHLHKHIARIFQILNLENDELDHLAKLLGQDIRADREYYHSPEAAMELAKIAKLLLAMENGSLEKFKGNSLEEIEVEDELESDVEQGITESSKAEKDNELESDLQQSGVPNHNKSDLKALYKMSRSRPTLYPKETPTIHHEKNMETMVMSRSETQAATMEKQSSQLTPEKDAQEHIKARRDKPSLEKRFIDPVKGSGVFTRESIEPSTFVVEYRGEISQKETSKKKCDTVKNDLFDFSWNGTNWCIDASEEDGSLGKLVNDDHRSPNCKMKKIVCEGKPHLCLFAVRKISPGEEITYKYGDASYPWRSMESNEKPNTSQKDTKAAASSPEHESVDDSTEAFSSAESGSDDEYVPDGEPSSDDHSNSDNDQRYQNVKKKMDSSKQKSFLRRPVDASHIQEDEADDSSDFLTSDEDAEANTKRNYCYVCGNAQTKISRHLFTHRKQEPEIAEVFALPPSSKERSRLLDELRERGNLKHNEEVSKTGYGELKVTPKAKTFAHCVYCKRMYRRKEMWLHMKKCQSKKPSTPSKRGRTKVLALVTAAESTELTEMSTDVSELLETLRKDEIPSVVLNDPHILQVAQWCCRSNKSKKARTNDGIKHRLKLLGRLLLILTTKSICSFEDAIKPQNFSTLVEAVREIIGFNEEMKSYHKRTLLMNLANSLQKIGYIIYAKALKEGADKQTMHEAETFIKLCEKEWSHSPPSKVNNIPFIHDVQIFYQCLEKTAASAVESLSMYESHQVYSALLRVTAAHVSFLNTKTLDVSRVTLESFNRRNEKCLEDASVPQSQLELILSKHFVKINVMNNKGKKVAVTVTPKLLTALTLLASKRETCGVHKNNPFLFARPDDTCTSVCLGQIFINSFMNRSGVKNPVSLKSLSFHKHVVRVFQILSLTNEEFDELAKLLGRNIRTDREYYQTPEAAVDIAKISELLSAVENGSLERFEGKSLEEIEILDELEPDVEQEDTNNGDSVENKESEKPLLLADIFSGMEAGFSSTPSKKSVTPLRKRGRGCSRKEQSENETPELSDEEKDKGSEEMPESHPVNKLKKTWSCSNEDVTRMSFSDDDEVMNVDFDIDTDEDDVRNRENDGDSDTNGPTTIPLIPDVQDRTIEDKHSSHTKKADSLPRSHSTGADYEDTMDIGTDYEDTMETDEENHVGKEDPVEEGEQSKWMDADSKSSPLKTEKKNKLSAALTGMKEVKIFLTKLDINKLQIPVHISQLPSVCDSVKWPAKDQPSHDDNNQCPTSSTSSTDMKNKPGNMTCSHCKKKMMKGQTAFQKKGFTDVFCSKTCLFALFPTNKSATKACHYCHKEIQQPLDLIMAAVDMKGTMKDFCSVICLSAFKSNVVSPKPPQSTCSTCKTSCTASCEVTLNDTLHKFCSASCLEDFCRDNMAVCDNCSSTCFKRPLKLKLKKEETKTICSDKCLKNFKENIKTSHQCTVCLTSQPVSDMVHYKTSEDMVELFCSQGCVISYKQWPQTKENTTLCQPNTRKIDTQLTENLSSEDGNIRNDASTAADLDTAIVTVSVLSTVCCHCEKEVKSGETLYRAKNSKDAFCSASCLSKKHPHIRVVFKKCYNCFQVIIRPTKIILAPVDDSGTMRELCSDACLTSVKSKRNMAPPKPPRPAGPRSACTMCNRFGFCKFKVNLDGLMYRICSDDCYKNYHKVNNLPIFMCDICCSICPEKHLILKMEDNSKTICTEECLVKFKEKIETPQLCPMCQTTHQMSDMVENKNEEGRLDFFCSNRCLVVFKAQSLTVSEPKTQTFDNNDTKEVKPTLKLIKEEPIDEEDSHNVSPSISMKEIKDEPKGDKEDLKIGSVFSLTDSTASSPTLTRDLTASCSHCKKALIDGETVYQRKGHAGIFCSTSCLLKFYQIKQAKNTCHFCLRVITQPQGVLQASVDAEETMKDFCSQSCLSSFNYKRVVTTKLPITPLASHSQCSMCSRYCISKHEIIQQDVVHKICSEPCFHRFCNINNMSICDNCHSHCSSPVVLKMKDSSKKLCSAECLAQFKQKIITLQPCTMCSTLRLMTDIIENKNSEDVVELFCSSSCVMASKIQAALGVPVNCDNCDKATVPACHLAMSDNSIRNFCTLTCAMNMKETQTATNWSAASDQTQSNLLKTPEKLPCAQCRHILKAAPKVVQKKDKIHFVCSLTCSEEFKRVNQIMGKCEYCKNERIISDTKRVDNKDCYFCSNGCKVLFHHELEKQWGEHCQSCAYCHSISKRVVTGKHKGKQRKFCSEECNSKYKMLLRHALKCDTCGRQGKLSQSLAVLGEVKHFCDLKCVLHFCNKKVDTVSSPPRPTGTAESFPVISNVISLAGALARQSSTSGSCAQHVSAPDIPTKVVGHASVQTVPKELKNKSMLCTPLVHNKGVSCTTQTMDREAQTDNFGPKVLPVPVPVYVPVPMSMYSQYTPKPVCLLLPLPVPIFIPVTPGDPDLPVKSMTESIQPERTDSSEGKINAKSQMKKMADEKIETEGRQEDGVVAEDEHGQDSHAPNEHSRKCDDAPHIDQQSTFNKEDSFSDTSVHSLDQPHTQEKPPPVSDVVMLSRRQPELPPSAPPALDMRRDPQSSVSPEPAPPPLQQTTGKGHNKSKAQNLQQALKDGKKETHQRDLSTAKSRKHRKLRSQHGIDAWKRWIQWRESQTNLYLVSTHAAMLNEDVLLCSTSELSDGLCRFITEVKQPDGSSYSPDLLFYLCLGIQKYLFDNGRLENIFSDRIYNKFCEEITRILKGFKPSVTASGYIHSRIEEEFLWDCKQLGAFSPIVLLNTLLFFCCKYFGFTTAEQHRQLSFAHVVRYTKTNQDHSQTTFLRFYPPLSTNKADADTDGIPFKKRKRGDSKDIEEMRENTQNPLRCPVRLYEFYLSKCPELVIQSTDLFYLLPDRSCVPNSPVWFSSTPLDHSTMEAMLIRILTVREVHGEMGEV